MLSTGSASKIVTRTFGNEATDDLNGDGKPDAALLLTQESGASGTFFYVVAALQTENGPVGTNAIFLGDRIAPQYFKVVDGELMTATIDPPISAENPGRARFAAGIPPITPPSGEERMGELAGYDGRHSRESRLGC